ncbi:MAG: hypothetical protein J6L05_07275 [Ruminococcus sp.]|nr:hypothetical protein [Ruminococcus sp.]
MKNRILSAIAAALLLCSCSANNESKQPLASDDTALINAVAEKKNELDEADKPYGVSTIYKSTGFDYNRDGTADYAFAYSLYSQFEFVVFDGTNAECLLDKRVMMDFIPDKTLCEIYSDNNNNFAERFSSKIQKATPSALTETIQIFSGNECYSFEAVYDNETGDFVHAYDKYSSYEEYASAQNTYLDGYSLLHTFSWEEYTEQNTDNEYIIDLSDSYEAVPPHQEDAFIKASDFFHGSANLSQWGTEAEKINELYKAAVNSDELMGHTIDFYDTLKDIDQNGTCEYIVASRFGFGDINDSLIIFDKDSDGNVQIVYTSAEDENLIWPDFQNINGYFPSCPIDTVKRLDGALFAPVYSDDFSLDENNCFCTSRWSNISIHNIRYQINYNGTAYQLIKLSDTGWEAEIVYENEEPTNKCKVKYTDYQS